MDAKIVRTEEEINKLLQWARELDSGHQSHYRGMTYEQGIIAMYEWLIGDSDDSPSE